MADATGQIALSVSIIKGRAQHAVNENLLYIDLFARSANRGGTGLASTLENLADPYMRGVRNTSQMLKRTERSLTSSSTGQSHTRRC